MSRSFLFRVPGSYTDVNGTTFVVPNAYEMAYSKSDVVKTEAHKLWLLDKSTWLPPTPYEASVYVWGYRPALLTNPYTGQQWAGHIDFFGRPGHYDNAPDITGLYEEVVFKLLDHVKNSHVNLGAAFGEAEQTLSLIATSARKLAMAARAAKRGDWKRAAGELGINPKAHKRYNASTKKFGRPYPGDATNSQKELANRWLELQFGWKPLLSDIDGAARFLAELGGSDPSRLRIRATATKWRPYNYPGKEVIDTSGTLPWQSHQNVGDGRHGFRIVVWYGVTNPSAVKAAALGLTNPLSVAWELTPWSFVADWVLPIGQLIDTLDAYNGKSFIGGTSTEFYRVDAKRVNRIVREAPLSHADSTCGYLHWRYMNRTVLTDFPRASMKLHIKNPLSVTHALDALALLSQTARSFFT